MRRTLFTLLIFVVIFISLFSGKSVSACWYHNFIPPTESDEYIDSYYLTFLLDEPVQYDGVTQTNGIIFVVFTKHYVAVINQDYVTIGVYLVDSETVSSIEQSETNDREVIIRYKNGESYIVNSINQMEIKENIYYLESESGDIKIKEQYLYLWGENYNDNYGLVENNKPSDESGNVVKENNDYFDSTNNEMPLIEYEDNNNFLNNFFLIIKTVFLLMFCILCIIIFIKI